MLQGLLDLEIVYGFIPPELLLPEIPDWYINFVNSDREPVISANDQPDSLLSNENETWEEYCERHNLIEVELLSDNELLNTTPEEPIFNYGHMKNFFKTPHFNLPSLYQIIDRYKWKKNLYRVNYSFPTTSNLNKYFSIKTILKNYKL